jgi:hypothetical protein
MLKAGPAFSQEELLSYTIASGDMRYIEISERDVFLRGDIQLGLVIRGKVSGCGPDCDVDLSHILLEQAMTCSGCKDPIIAFETAQQFGRRLGRKVASRLGQDLERITGCDQLCNSFEIILKSMGALYTHECNESVLKFNLDVSPLSVAAKKHGFTQWTHMARNTFIAMCEAIAQTLQPTWTIERPNHLDAEGGIRQIAIRKDA